MSSLVTPTWANHYMATERQQQAGDYVSVSYGMAPMTFPTGSSTLTIDLPARAPVANAPPAYILDRFYVPSPVIIPAPTSIPAPAYSPGTIFIPAPVVAHGQVASYGKTVDVNFWAAVSGTVTPPTFDSSDAVNHCNCEDDCCPFPRGPDAANHCNCDDECCPFPRGPHSYLPSDVFSKLLARLRNTRLPTPPPSPYAFQALREEETSSFDMLLEQACQALTEEVSSFFDMLLKQACQALMEEEPSFFDMLLEQACQALMEEESSFFDMLLDQACQVLIEEEAVEHTDDDVSILDIGQAEAVVIVVPRWREVVGADGVVEYIYGAEKEKKASIADWISAVADVANDQAADDSISQ